MDKKLKNTYSVCPVCGMKLSASIVKRGQECFIEKTCPEHGGFSSVIWRGDVPAFEDWGDYSPPAERSAELPDCPNGCGLCAGHLQKTCCVLVEVTSRCNLSCPVCFAKSGGTAVEPSVAELFGIFQQLVKGGRTFLQLSGGEPTVRDDLPDIVAAAKAAGCAHIQLNSNGIRLGQDKPYLKALKEAGLDFVFMQFDGTEDDIFIKLRGRPLLREKTAAIKACSEELLGVTLVPTLVPGVNDHNIGDILDFGLKNSPAVRGVHFQPVSYFGRYPHPPGNHDRITLPEVLHAIEEQTSGRLKISDFLPSSCDHPRCGFHGDFVVLPNTVMRLTPKAKKNACCRTDDNAHLKNRNFVARRWKRMAAEPEQCCGPKDYGDMDTFLGRIKSHGFTITAMAFQDAFTLDIERLRRCSLHVYKDGRIIPFCAQYITYDGAIR
jgi:uncharacterized radical SAM superfamily Fe-S cluster-containing enzyme